MLVLTITVLPRPDDGKGVYKYTLRGWNDYGFADAIPVGLYDGYVGDIEYLCTRKVPLCYLCD